MKKSSIFLILTGVILASLLATGVLAISHHRVTVVDAISINPIGGAYITVDLVSGRTVEVGQADETGELDFWIAPLPLPARICAQALFYPPNCVNAISLVRQRIELAVPSALESEGNY